jgi:hypothetical protein
MDYKAEVDRIFREAFLPRGSICENPVTGGKFVRGVDPVKPQKERAERALMARDWFLHHAPPDAPPLPLCYGDREDLKVWGLPHLVAWFAGSVQSRDFVVDGHPLFEDSRRDGLILFTGIYHAGSGTAEALPAPSTAGTWSVPLLDLASRWGP